MSDDIARLVADLDEAASGRPVMAKVKRILKRSAVIIREDWQAAATEFPSPTRERKYSYSIGFDYVRANGSGTASVAVGSDDPLLEVVEYGSTNHPPHGYGRRALEHGASELAAAMALIDDLKVRR